MQFSTKVAIPKSEFTIDYNSQIISLGSCFAENIGEKFEYYKFRSSMNPFGIIFNPISLEKLIRRCIQKDYFSEKDIFYYNELWHCFEVHSQMSHFDKEVMLQNLNQAIQATNQQITESTHIIITLGTAWVYRNIEKDEIVANCHKVPQKEFGKELLSVEAIQQSLKNIIDMVSNVNPSTKFIFTISPVRHLKDGFVENQRSKAHLIAAVHSLQFAVCSLQDAGSRLQSEDSHLPSADCRLPSAYFPSYEIMMDELRDYRYYAEDMLHPSKMAIDYIWEKFKESTIAESAHKTMEEVGIIQKGLAHRAFNPNSQSHLKFIANLEQRISRLQEQFSFIKFHLK